MLNIDTINIVISKIFVLFLLSLFGYLAGKLKIINNAGYKSLVNLVLFITTPALVLVSMTDLKDLTTLYYIPLIGFVSISILLSFSRFISRFVNVSHERKDTFTVLSSMPNSAFFGFPVVLSLLGQEGLAYAVVFDMGLTIMTWTIVIAILKGGQKHRFSTKFLLNPVLISAIIGLSINIIDLHILEIILDPFRLMGSATVPLAMFLIGFSVSRAKISLLNSGRQILFIIIIKLVLAPILVYFLLKPFGLNPTLVLTLFIVTSMPSMASTSILVEKFGGDLHFAIETVFITTVLSVITIPFMLYIIMLF